MGETRRSFDPEFRAGVVRIVWETGKSIASVARDLGMNTGTLASWVQTDRLARERDADGELVESELEELTRLRRQKAEWARERAELEMGHGCAQALGGLVGQGGDRPVSARGLHRLPEDRARCSPRHGLPDSRGLAVLVLQMA
ncbi:transposase [Streptosporangium sp. NPDC006007]|uniref:transposase n=1 Tax=Streptosporangium sp. NPDC006007 TaxID=3154575 RepID=UPI0033B68B3F